MLEVVRLAKQYSTPRGPLTVLSDVSLSLSPGEAAAIMGPSGSGKSTLLYILGALEPPTSGQVSLDGKNPFELDPSALATFRNEQIGFVFQDHCLLPQCSVLENVLIPTLVARGAANDTQRARELIAQVAHPGAPAPPVRRADRQPRSRGRRQRGGGAARPAPPRADDARDRDAQRTARGEVPDPVRADEQEPETRCVDRRQRSVGLV